MTAASAAARAAARARPDDEAERILGIAYRYALGVLRDREAAADVAQDVTVRVVTGRGALRDPDALEAWVRTIAIRAAIREAQKSQRRRVAEREHGAREVRPAEPQEAVGHAIALLDGLPPRQKAALTLRYVHDVPDDEISRILRCRPATVRSLLSRGRDAVRTRLDEDDR